MEGEGREVTSPEHPLCTEYVNSALPQFYEKEFDKLGGKKKFIGAQ